jgi:hypothetical protein
MIMVGAPFDAALVQLLRSINELEVVSRQHFVKAAELHKKANDYYENKKLGK